MLNILAVCGSRVAGGNMEALLKYALASVENSGEVETEFISLAGMDIAPCTHCNWCLKKQTDGRPCAQDDGMSEIYQKLMAADGIVLASPAHFGRLSGALADCLDRTRAILHGKIYKLPLQNKVGGSMTVAYYRGGGMETTLESINAFFLIHQMVLATSGLYQLGAGACTSLQGTGEFEPEPRHLVMEDEFGVNSATLLLKRVVELARIMKAGQEALNLIHPNSHSV
jgi:multimeric flavodoxin WrbA